MPITEHGMEANKGTSPRLWLLLAIGLPIAIADVLLWMLLGFACATFDNIQGEQARLCNHNDPQMRIHLPLVGAAAVLLSIYGARHYRRTWIFVLGVLIALATGIYIYDVANH